MQLGSFPNPVCLPDLPLLSLSMVGQFTLELPNMTSLVPHWGLPLVLSSMLLQLAPDVSASHYDTTAALSPKLINRNLNLNFVSISEFLTDTFQDNLSSSLDRNEKKGVGSSPTDYQHTNLVGVFWTYVVRLVHEVPQQSP